MTILTIANKDNLFQFIEKDETGYYMRQCRGCKTYEEGRDTLTKEQKQQIVYICNISIPFKEGKICPCSRCVVKMVCTTRCQELIDHHPVTHAPTKGDKL